MGVYNPPTGGGGGSGTVTDVSVVTANGVSGSVATSTTTPAITLTLGAITPSTVNGNTVTTGTGTLTLSTFTLTASGNGSVSGSNTGDQTNISGNAATVTTNANLTGPITSVGNATSIASQTGTGTKFVVDTSPTLVTPVLGVASATSVALTGTAGAGFEEYPSQSANPAAPASGFREFADATGRKSWIRQADGFVRTWDATLTANRVYTLPDATGDIALRGQAAAAFTAFV